MTARYLGMNRSDGLTVTDLEHISQSIGDIVCVFSRRLRA